MGRVPPCGAAYFAPGGKVGKTPPGTAPMSAYAERALKVAFPRTPIYGGDVFLEARNFYPAGKI